MRRPVSLLVVLAALVLWMAADAASRSSAARTAHTRRAVEAAEAALLSMLADPRALGEVLVEPPERAEVTEAADVPAALALARREQLWRASRDLSEGSAGVIGSGADAWLVQRGRWGVRGRLWDEVAAEVGEATGARLSLDREGVAVLPGLLRGPVTASVPSAARWSLGPWVDVLRALAAVGIASLLAADALRARARREARDVVLARVSHELRTPAASIRALSDALRSGAVDDPAERQQFLELVGSEAERLAVGIDRLLRAARGEEAPVRRVHLDLAEWTRALAGRWRARLPGLVVEAPPALGWSFDPGRLDEAVEALLDNAAKHGGPGVVLRLEARGETVVLSVSDDGPGVPAADRARVFERLQRVEGRPGDPGGHGLGLWAAAEVARAHGGTLTLEGGATFALTLGREA